MKHVSIFQHSRCKAQFSYFYWPTPVCGEKPTWHCNDAFQIPNSRLSKNKHIWPSYTRWKLGAEGSAGDFQLNLTFYFLYIHLFSAPTNYQAQWISSLDKMFWDQKCLQNPFSMMCTAVVCWKFTHWRAMCLVNILWVAMLNTKECEENCISFF